MFSESLNLKSVIVILEDRFGKQLSEKQELTVSFDKNDADVENVHNQTIRIHK